MVSRRKQAGVMVDFRGKRPSGLVTGPIRKRVSKGMPEFDRQVYHYLLTLTAAVIALGTIFYHFVEKLPWLDANYFSVVILSTVGYGDITPHTEMGKIFTLFYIFAGVSSITSFIHYAFRRRAYNRYKARRNALPAGEVEVVSARPDWIELRVPCELNAVSTSEQLLAPFLAGIPPETREAVAMAFREMLENAIEHGCWLDKSKHIEVSCVRLKQAVVCRIKDPGEGFDPARIDHAAINNPDDDPLRHARVRAEQDMRPGGFGILLTSRLVDEMVYNERHNEVIIVKYLPDCGRAPKAKQMSAVG
jgi:anti-sigma regulatory factor (Ser/Thr protein kinase)